MDVSTCSTDGTDGAPSWPAVSTAVFWGTMFPVLSEAVRGEKITVGEGYYEQVALPIGVALLILTGVGPLVAWRKA
ncbi:MAG: hypothetical protein E8D45_07925, partial [Nitrospira sp.]